jgi:formate hydrogenlyase transcriptional activator
MIPEHTEQRTILIVDDTPENLKVLIAFLEQFDFRIMVAQGGETALKRVQYVVPDIILLDVLMPDMNGFETCRRLKEHEATRDIPVIFMTALSETVNKVKGFDVGGVDYLTKPVQHEEVLARINAHLTIRKLQQQLQEQNSLLEEQNERFRTLSEATFEGILIHDKGRILEVNQPTESMFEYQRSAILGKNVSEFVTPEFRQTVLEHMRTEDGTPYEAEGIRQDGSIFPIEIQARTMPYQGHDVRVVAVRDLTWRRVMEEEKAHLQRENVTLRSTIKDRYKFGEIIGKSPVMQDVYQSLVKASASDANVVIYGESGTGKELVAQTIHNMSERKEKAFIAVNCGAVPGSLFEREFFGHRKGAFTGATVDKAGYFDRAHRGTLFLDEVGELSPTLQVKLLRVLQDGEYTPLGDTTSKKADVRIIAATNRDLKELLRKGLIREDFFYRIRVIVINLPPLRNRKEDIPLLIEHFLEQYARDEDRPTIPGRIIEMLCAYHWPGNIRELQNELQRYLTEQHLEFIGNFNPESGERNDMLDLVFAQGGLSFRESVETFEKCLIARVLEQNSGNTGKTASMLDIPLRTLYRKMKKYQLS